MAVDPLTNGNLLTEYRLKHMMGQQNALKLLEELDKVYGEKFGRSYGGAVEEYRCDDADYVIVTMGSMTGVAKDRVDKARADGKKVGLLKMRMVRPFPCDRVAKGALPASGPSAWWTATCPSAGTPASSMRRSAPP